MKSLKVLQHPLADSENQLEVLGNSLLNQQPTFKQKLEQNGVHPLRASGIDVLQLNLGKMCNQTCKHCHVDAGPDRKEIMDRSTMQWCLDVLQKTDINIVDLTGGAPELNPDFRWFVEQIRNLGKQVMVRCNLTIILANKRFHDLPDFFKKHQVEVVSSLPGFTQDRTDRQRGEGVFENSIKALQMLNQVGYGQIGSGLILNLVYNPAGAFLPPSQTALEKEYKIELSSRYGIVFNQLFAITNMPISRYLDYLLSSGNYNRYMDKLISAFNPASVQNLMCRNTLSVGWDGFLYDCDFNQMLDLKVAERRVQHISEFNLDILKNRATVVNQHCFGCTAGEGSSCGGSLLN
ncbi:MAG: radical SAM/Cys-rich domain protein [Bacteroidetes bacterium]|nr:radical SAM/Cys-rich domain protein [Bacteroidota bacterium]